jgi:hypothetical protein
MQACKRVGEHKHPASGQSVRDPEHPGPATPTHGRPYRSPQVTSGACGALDFCRITGRLFFLDAGRLCVLLSRHRLGCLIVGRAGVADLLAVHAPTAERILGLDDDPEYDGWQAHLTVLDRLGGAAAIRTVRR